MPAISRKTVPYKITITQKSKNAKILTSKIGQPYIEIYHNKSIYFLNADMLKFQTHPLFLKKIVPRPQEIHNGGYFLRENGIYHQNMY